MGKEKLKIENQTITKEEQLVEKVRPEFEELLKGCDNETDFLERIHNIYCDLTKLGVGHQSDVVGKKWEHEFTPNQSHILCDILIPEGKKRFPNLNWEEIKNDIFYGEEKFAKGIEQYRKE